MYECPWVCGGITCTKTYKNKYTKHALQHFHQHLKDARCVGTVKDIMITYAKDHGIMKSLKKRGHVKVDVVVG